MLPFLYYFLLFSPITAKPTEFNDASVPDTIIHSFGSHLTSLTDLFKSIITSYSPNVTPIVAKITDLPTCNDENQDWPSGSYCYIEYSESNCACEFSAEDHSLPNGILCCKTGKHLAKSDELTDFLTSKDTRLFTVDRYNPPPGIISEKGFYNLYELLLPVDPTKIASTVDENFEKCASDDIETYDIMRSIQLTPDSDFYTTVNVPENDSLEICALLADEVVELPKVETKSIAPHCTLKLSSSDCPNLRPIVYRFENYHFSNDVNFARTTGIDPNNFCCSISQHKLMNTTYVDVSENYVDMPDNFKFIKWPHADCPEFFPGFEVEKIVYDFRDSKYYPWENADFHIEFCQYQKFNMETVVPTMPILALTTPILSEFQNETVTDYPENYFNQDWPCYLSENCLNDEQVGATENFKICCNNPMPAFIDIQDTNLTTEFTMIRHPNMTCVPLIGENVTSIRSESMDGDIPTCNYFLTYSANLDVELDVIKKVYQRSEEIQFVNPVYAGYVKLRDVSCEDSEYPVFIINQDTEDHVQAECSESWMRNFFHFDNEFDFHKEGDDVRCSDVDHGIVKWQFCMGHFPNVQHGLKTDLFIDPVKESQDQGLCLIKAKDSECQKGFEGHVIKFENEMHGNQNDFKFDLSLTSQLDNKARKQQIWPSGSFLRTRSKLEIDFCCIPAASAKIVEPTQNTNTLAVPNTDTPIVNIERPENHETSGYEPSVQNSTSESPVEFETYQTEVLTETMEFNPYGTITGSTYEGLGQVEFDFGFVRYGNDCPLFLGKAGTDAWYVFPTEANNTFDFIDPKLGSIEAKGVKLNFCLY